jgi:hypothetical protein
MKGSIIIISYDFARYLPAAINLVLEQTYADIEKSFLMTVLRTKGVRSLHSFKRNNPIKSRQSFTKST